MRRFGKGSGLGAALVALAMMSAACGNDEEADAGETNPAPAASTTEAVEETTAPTAAEETTAPNATDATTAPVATEVTTPASVTEETPAPSATEEAPPAVSGDPVKVGVIYNEGNAVANTPELRASAEAAADYVNAELGGYAGRPVEIVACAGKNDPATSQQCAQKFVDAGVVAVAGLDGVWADNGLPVLEAAGVMNMTTPIGGKEFASPVSFPLAGGSLVSVAALVKYFTTEQPITKAAAIYVDIAAAKNFAEGAWCGALMAAGVTECTAVPVKGDAADVTPAVIQALEGDPDVVMLFHAAAGCERLLRAANDAGALEGTAWATSASCADKSTVLDPLGDAANGLIIGSDWASYDDQSDPEAALFVDVLDRYSEGQEPTNVGLGGFASVLTLKTVADALGPDSLTAADFLEYMKTVSGLDVFMGGTLDASTTVPNMPQLRGVTARIMQIQDGNLVDIGGGEIYPFE